MAVEKSYESTQIEAFTALVSDGTYSEGFDHAPQAKEFFGRVMSLVIKDITGLGGSSVLDCGCGNGAWLDFLASEVAGESFSHYFGYDLTPQMVEVARRRLSRLGSAAHFQAGSILEYSSYNFDDHSDKFELIFTYDVVQQLPKKLQYTAIEVMLDHLVEGGVAVIFDNDCYSDFGRKMGRKKFLTRYFGLKLVPRYYCNASYPPLNRISEQIDRLQGYSAEVQVSPSGMKRALIIRKKLPMAV